MSEDMCYVFKTINTAKEIYRNDLLFLVWLPNLSLPLSLALCAAYYPDLSWFTACAMYGLLP